MTRIVIALLVVGTLITTSAIAAEPPTPREARLAKQVAALKLQVGGLNRRVKSLTAERDGLRGQVQGLKRQVTSLTAERDGLRGQVATLGATIATLTAERDEARRVAGFISGPIRDGRRRVGSEIQPGTYRNTDSSQGCYWERLSGFGGTLNEIIANDFTNGLTIVTISPIRRWLLFLALRQLVSDLGNGYGAVNSPVRRKKAQLRGGFRNGGWCASAVSKERLTMRVCSPAYHAATGRSAALDPYDRRG